MPPWCPGENRRRLELLHDEDDDDDGDCLYPASPPDEGKGPPAREKLGCSHVFSGPSEPRLARWDSNVDMFPCLIGATGKGTILMKW